MTREEAIQELQNCKGLIQQDGQDYLDERDFPLLDMAIQALREAQKHEETFEWCTDCKEYDKDNHCCHRWSKVIRNTVEELKADTVSREEYNELLRNKISLANSEEAVQEAVPTVVRVTMSDGNQYYLEHERVECDHCVYKWGMKGGAE